MNSIFIIVFIVLFEYSLCNKQNDRLDLHNLRSKVNKEFVVKYINPDVADRVDVSIYYVHFTSESSEFLVNVFDEWYKSPDFKDAISLDLIPVNNICKKGCLGGDTSLKHESVQSCSVVLEDQEKYYPFIICTERLLGNITDLTIEECARKSEIDYLKLQQCYKNMCIQLEYPPKSYLSEIRKNNVLVVVNNKEMKVKKSKKILKRICKSYKGLSPKICYHKK